MTVHVARLMLALQYNTLLRATKEAPPFMREMAATGFMHNRGRMVVAMFLTKNLLGMLVFHVVHLILVPLCEFRISC